MYNYRLKWSNVDFKLSLSPTHDIWMSRNDSKYKFSLYFLRIIQHTFGIIHVLWYIYHIQLKWSKSALEKCTLTKRLQINVIFLRKLSSSTASKVVMLTASGATQWRKFRQNDDFPVSALGRGKDGLNPECFCYVFVDIFEWFIWMQWKTTRNNRWAAACKCQAKSTVESIATLRTPRGRADTHATQALSGQTIVTGIKHISRASTGDNEPSSPRLSERQFEKYQISQHSH